jgi:phage-related minor tail protein
MGLQRFAAGGAFTNQIVDQPTYFAFAAGVGLMGEAGPEAIMPLKRGSDGRLGVTANGGGDVQVIVNDMRSSAGAAPVETKTGRGPDGRRMISVMIRDEMRRQIRSGDLDRDMGAVYGNQRQLARK